MQSYENLFDYARYDEIVAIETIVTIEVIKKTIEAIKKTIEAIKKTIATIKKTIATIKK